MAGQIWHFANPDKTALGFPMPGDLTKYLAGEVFSVEGGRYRYTQPRNASVIVMSRDGEIFGHLDIERRVKPNDQDRAAFPKIRSTYLVGTAAIYENRVPVSLLGSPHMRFGHKLTEAEFEKIKTAAGKITLTHRPTSLNVETLFPTRHLIQYHNTDGEENSGLPISMVGDSDLGIYTRNPMVKSEVGSRMFLIVGLGRPRSYFLWYSFIIEKLADEDGFIQASGPGWMLNPPQRLYGDDFEAFRQSCAKFITVRRVDDMPYLDKLKSLSDSFKDQTPNSATLAFADEIVSLIPEEPTAYVLRSGIQQLLGNFKAAALDLERASEGYILADEPDVADELIEEAKGLLGDIEEEEEPESEIEAEERIQRSIRLRRGQSKFRERLLEIYGGKCAVTRCDAEAALEAAHIRPYSGPATNTPRNGLLLRADIHTLFDLGFLRINPATMAIDLDETLRSSYGDLHGKPIWQPEQEHYRPKREFLEERWGDMVIE